VNGYPDGTTQAMHDAAHQSYTADESNAIQREVEWRAECEVRRNAQVFTDWLMDRRDISDLSHMISYYNTGEMYECGLIVDNIVRDYQQYRVATLDAVEESEIREGL
jgi:hypothetical protein